MSEGGQPIRSLVPRPMFSLQRMYYISGDVIHPQLWESGSGYETSLSGGTSYPVTPVVTFLHYTHINNIDTI